jgi:ABC-2 type transport system permease protein
MMRTILHILRKEFIQIRRDPRMLAIVFIAPVFQLIILGYAANLDVRNIRTVIYDGDNTAASREIVARFTNSGYFTTISYTNTLAEIDPLLDNGDASIAIIVPKGFAKKITAGIPAEVQVIADGSETNAATAGLNYASRIVLGYANKVMLERLDRQPGNLIVIRQIEPATRVWYNPDLRSRNFMVPGVLGLLLMVMTTMLTSLATVKEREIGTLEQLIVTPISPTQLIIGKIAPFTIIGLIDILLVILIATLWFGIPVKGSIFLLFGLSVIFLMTTLGLGLFVSTVSRTQQQAMMTAVFFVMLPMIFLSGFVFPIENMPNIIQWSTYIMPLRYYFVILRGLFLKGVGIVELWDQALALFIFGVCILGASIVRFRKRLG